MPFIFAYIDTMDSLVMSSAVVYIVLTITILNKIIVNFHPNWYIETDAPFKCAKL